MVVVIIVVVVAGVWDGLSHSLFLLWPILILQAVISQAYCVPPIIMGVSLGPGPIIIAP